MGSLGNGTINGVQIGGSKEMVSGVLEELTQIESDLRASVRRAEVPKIKRQLATLDQVLDRMAESWSGSYLGYHAHVYYSGFGKPAPGICSTLNGVWDPVRNNGWNMIL